MDNDFIKLLEIIVMAQQREEVRQLLNEEKKNDENDIKSKAKITDKITFDHDCRHYSLSRDEFNVNLLHFGIEEKLYATLGNHTKIFINNDCTFLGNILHLYNKNMSEFVKIFKPTSVELQQNDFHLLSHFIGDNILVDMIELSGITFVDLCKFNYIPRLDEKQLKFVIEMATKDLLLLRIDGDTILNIICKKYKFDLTFIFKKFRFEREELTEAHKNKASAILWLGYHNNMSLDYLFNTTDFQKNDFLHVDNSGDYLLYLMCKNSNKNTNDILDEYKFTIEELDNDKFKNKHCLVELIRHGKCTNSEIFQELFHTKLFAKIYSYVHMSKKARRQFLKFMIEN